MDASLNYLGQVQPELYIRDNYHSHPARKVLNHGIH